MATKCYDDGMSPGDDSAAGPDSARFVTTDWSVVLKAGRRSSPDSDQALASLCRVYWYPLYAYVRRRGQSAEDAQDLTQEFFSRLLDRVFLRNADQDRGRFRAFLLTVFKRFLASEHAKQQTQKRGGALKRLSIDFDAGEDRYRCEPTDDWTPEKIYERRWAFTLLDQVLVRLRDEYVVSGKQELFKHCEAHLTNSADGPGYRETSTVLQMSEGAVRVAVHRMRQRYRALLKVAVAETVDEAEDVDTELAYLRSAIRGDSAR